MRFRYVPLERKLVKQSLLLNSSDVQARAKYGRRGGSLPNSSVGAADIRSETAQH
jgi:hypothetical protein